MVSRDNRATPQLWTSKQMDANILTGFIEEIKNE